MRDELELSIPKRSKNAKPTIFQPMDTKPHFLNVVFDFVKPYINWQTLIGHHFGLKGKLKTCSLKETKRPLN